jgi:hypothetical protein
MGPIRHLAAIQRLLSGFMLLASRFEYDHTKFRSDELQRECYARRTGSDDAQVTI